VPGVVVTADNGVVAPVLAGLVTTLADNISDAEVLQATAVAAVAVSCAAFGAVHLVLKQVSLAHLVRYLPYSIAMGFLSGIGLLLCSSITLAGEDFAPKVSAVAFALTLCLGSWWRGWSLSLLLPVLLFGAISAFYLLGAPQTWLLQFEGKGPTETEMACLWSPAILGAVDWCLLLQFAGQPIGVLFLLGLFQNCIFADLYARTPGVPVAVTADSVIFEFGQTFMIGGILGFAGGFHNMACMSVAHEMNSYGRWPSAIVAVLSCAILYLGLEFILLVPRFVFAGLLVWVGLKFLRAYLWQTSKMLPFSETLVSIVVAISMYFGGFAVGIAVGLVSANTVMVKELALLSCVQHTASGGDTRSNVVRPAHEEELLRRRGEATLVLRLAPGYLFFGTSAELLRVVEKRLGSIASRLGTIASHDPTFLLKDVEADSSFSDEEGLSHVVIDVSLCRGFDGTFSGVLQRLLELGKRHNFRLILAGLSAQGSKWLQGQITIPSDQLFADLDRALEHTEDELLASAGLLDACISSGVPIRHKGVSGACVRSLSRDNFAAAVAEAGGGANWSLLHLYSDASSTSRTLRPVITHTMALLEHRCELQEACAQNFPALQERFGPAPLIALFRQDAAPLVLSDKQLGPPVQPWEVARKLERWMDKADKKLASGPERQSRQTTIEILEQFQPSEIWQEFLNLRGPRESDSTLMQLAEHVRGPLVLQPGDEVIRKGDVQRKVFFVIAGFVSLWNEGGQNTVNWKDVNADTGKDSVNNCQLRARYKAESKKLSKGTSRLLQVGPGWVLGGLSPAGSALGPRPALFTCKAETQVCMLELTDDMKLSNNPLLTLAVRELLAQHEAQLLEHAASVLSTLHSVVFSH